MKYAVHVHVKYISVGGFIGEKNMEFKFARNQGFSHPYSSPHYVAARQEKQAVREAGRVRQASGSRRCSAAFILINTYY